MNKKILLSIMFALIMIAIPSVAQNKSYKGNVKFENIEIGKKDGQLVARFIINLSDLELKRQTQLTFTPMIVSKDGSQVLGFEPYVVARKTRMYMIMRKASSDSSFQLPENLVLRKNKKEQTIPVEIKVPFQNWMREASLKVDENVTGCAMCEQGNDLYALSNKLVGQPYVPHYQLAYITPEPEPVKIRSDKFIAHFNFVVSRYELLKNYKNNAYEFARVDSVVKNIIDDKNVTVRDVQIDGYASPEGQFNFNITLSDNRAKSFVNYLKKTYGIDGKKFKVTGHGEDWDGLVKAVEASDMPQKAQILKIIADYSIQNGREKKLMDMEKGQPYKYMLENLFPPLRRTEYTFTYQVRGFDINEAREIIKHAPHQLSLNEMYLVANSYPKDSKEREEVLEIAAKYFPNSPVSRLNLAVERMQRGETIGVEKLLTGLGENPEVLNSLGVYFAMMGQSQKAIQCFKKAGNAQAAHNLKELKRKMED